MFDYDCVLEVWFKPLVFAWRTLATKDSFCLILPLYDRPPLYGNVSRNDNRVNILSAWLESQLDLPLKFGILELKFLLTSHSVSFSGEGLMYSRRVSWRQHLERSGRFLWLPLALYKPHRYWCFKLCLSLYFILVFFVRIALFSFQFSATS